MFAIDLLKFYGVKRTKGRCIFTKDEEGWITVHPHGEGTKGQPVKIEKRTGEILGGLGGKFNGQHISALPEHGAHEEHGAQALIKWYNSTQKGKKVTAKPSPTAITIKKTSAAANIRNRIKNSKFSGVSNKKDIVQAEAYLKNVVGLPKYVGLKGLPYEQANEATAMITKIAEMFPHLITENRLISFGYSKDLSKARVEEVRQTQWYAQRLQQSKQYLLQYSKYKNMSAKDLDKEVARHVEKGIDKFKDYTKNTCAYYSHANNSTIASGILHPLASAMVICSTSKNSSAADNKKYVERGWWVPGGETLGGTIAHESGHALDALLGLSQDPEIKKLNKSFFDDVAKLTKNGKAKLGQIEDGKYVLGRLLSNYGGTNIREFIAESWCEYMCSPSPRPLAKSVGDRIVKLYGDKYGHDL